MTTGDRIREARKSAGLTQKELGERLGISYQTVAQWENNLRNPKLVTVQRIAEVLGKHWAYFVDEITAEAFDLGHDDGVDTGIADEKMRHDLINALWERYCRAVELSNEEQEMIRKYRQLDERGKSAVLNVLEHEYAALPGDTVPRQA